LNDLLQDRFKTFLYSKKQEALAGLDGEEAFNAVFRKKARCVAVLYRNEWGQTPFTRIEQTAIRNRAFDEGYDFTLFIPTTSPPTLPAWLPKTRLWFGLSRYGLKGAAAVIEARIQEAGGEPHTESIAERAARFQRAQDLEDAKRRFRQSEDGVRQAEAAFERLTKALEEKLTEIAGSNERLKHLKVRRQLEYRLVSGLGLFMNIGWRVRFANSLDESWLFVDLHDGCPRLPGLVAWDEPRRLQTLKFDYALVGIDRHGYIERSGESRWFTAEELADYLLRLYMDECEKQQHSGLR
jgi:hypothetical protein